MTKHMALHETLEVHELLTFKNLCLTKAVTMSLLVSDPQLKAILSNDVTSGTNFINRLKEFITDRGHQNE
jgi:similar to spore coat protein